MQSKTSAKKKVAALLLLAALFALLLGGTYAWRNHNQHKTNEMSNKVKKHDVTLVEDFQQKDDWKVEDGPLTKKIAVKNTGSTDTAAEFEQVYVRIQLKEYMDLIPLKVTETPQNYMIDTTGAFLVFATEAQAQAAYPGHTVSYLTDAVSNTSGYFVQTQAGDPNGQYGRKVITEYSKGEKQFVVGDASMENAREDAAAKHNADPNAECDYPAHPWSGTDLAQVLAQPGADTYIKWLLGDDVVLLSEWENPQSAKYHEYGAFWIIDDTTANPADAWIYWGQALYPGEVTSDFLEAVELIKQPDGDFYYAIHTELEAASLDDLFTDAPQAWIDNMKDQAPSIQLVFSTPAPYSVTVGNVFDAPGVIIKPDGADKGVTWTSSNPGVATVDADGNVTGIAPGTTVITVTSNATGKSTSYTITINPNIDPGKTLTKTVENIEGHSPSQVGDTLKYTIVADNAPTSQGDWDAVTVTDIIPAGTSFVPGSITLANPGSAAAVSVPDSALSGSTLTIDSGTIPQGSNATITFEVTIGTDAIGTIIKNQAQAIGTGGITTPPPTIPDAPVDGTDATKSVTKSVTATPTHGDGKVHVGDTLHYTITAANAAGSTIPWDNVVITDHLPSGIQFVSGTLKLGPTSLSDAGHIVSGVLTVDAGNIAAGNSAIVTFDATVLDSAKGSTITNTATAVGDGGVTSPDGGSNGTDAVGNAAPSVNKAVANLDHPTGPNFMGDTLEYTIRLANDATATDAWKSVSVGDTIPNYTTFVAGSVTLNGTNMPAIAPTSGKLTVPVGDIAINSTATVTFRVTINTGSGGQTITNTANATGTNTDTTTGGSVPGGSLVDSANVTNFTVNPNFCTVPTTNATVYNIASSDVEQTFDFTTATTGTGTLIPTGNWTVDSTNISVAGAANAGTITIPANATAGTYNVTAAAAQNAGKAVSFKVVVNTLKATVAALSSPPTVTGSGNTTHAASTFFAGGQEWRVLDNSDLSQVLILSEHVLNYTTQWNPTNSTAGGYMASSIRTTCTNLYNNDMGWAHSYAVLPNTDATWSATGSVTTGLTSCSGTPVPTSGVDGCFLLSYADMYTSGKYGFSASTAADANRIGTQVTSPGIGAARDWWLRSPYSSTVAYFVIASGANNANNASNTSGLRPALYLNVQ